MITHHMKKLDLSVFLLKVPSTVAMMVHIMNSWYDFWWMGVPDKIWLLKVIFCLNDKIDDSNQSCPSIVFDNRLLRYGRIFYSLGCWFLASFVSRFPVFGLNSLSKLDHLGISDRRQPTVYTLTTKKKTSLLLSLWFLEVFTLRFSKPFHKMVSVFITFRASGFTRLCISLHDLLSLFFYCTLLFCHSFTLSGWRQNGIWNDICSMLFCWNNYN